MLENFRNFWRKKEELDAETKKLISLKGSEAYKVWTDKLRKLLVEEFSILLNTPLDRDKQIITLVTEIQSIYKILRFVPNEILSLEMALDEIEKAEDQESHAEELKKERVRRASGAI